MGKGDLRSRRGKIWRGTNGKSRPQNGKKRDHAAEAKSTA
jgi:30S ribosomal protein S31